MKSSPLIDKLKNHAKSFTEYEGQPFPRVFSDVNDEYRTARTGAAVMARSYLEHLRVVGSDHLDLLHRLTTNDLRNLQPGEGQVNIFTNEKGRIIERVTLHKAADEIRLMTSSGTGEKVAAWIDKYTFIEDVTVENLSDKLGVVSLFGPESGKVLASLLEDDFQNLPDRHFRDLEWRGQRLTVSRTNELRFSGFDLISDHDALPELWDSLLEHKTEFDLKPIGEAAYDILRIEAGWPLAGRDYDETINPHEALMLDYVDFDKGCYIGQEVVARLDTYEKVQKYLVGLTLEGNAPVKPQDKIFVDEHEVGSVTSVTDSPSLNKKIALGYVRSKFLDSVQEVRIVSDDQGQQARVVRLPFEIPEI